MATGANTVASCRERRGKEKDLSHIACYNCEKPGHYASNCPAPKKETPGAVDVVAALRSRYKSDELRHSAAVVGLPLRGETYYLVALLDTCATSNFISQQAVKELGLGPGEALPRGLRTLGGQPLQTYRQHPVFVDAGDSRGRSVHTSGTFIAADFVGFDIILGLPWLTQWNADIQVGNKEWWYTDLSDVTAP